MEIRSFNQINFTSIKQIQPKAKQSFVTSPLKKDTFTKSEFTLDSAMHALRTTKGAKNKPKFSNYQLETLNSSLKEAPEKWTAINSLAQNPKINGEFVSAMSLQSVDKLNELKFYSEVKNENGETKYDGKAMMNFTDKANTEDLIKARPLTKTSLSAKNITTLAQERKSLDFNKLAENVLAFEKELKGKSEEISVSKDNYSQGEVIFKSVNKDKSITEKGFDKNLKLIYESNKTFSADGKFSKTVENDLRNRTTTELTADEDNYVGRPIFLKEKIETRDMFNNVVKTRYSEPSEVKGVLNVKEVDKNGKETILSSGSVDKKSGIVTVKRNFTSFDGTKTEYLYENDPTGNRIADYKITDKNGKVLLKNSEAFEIISPNKFVSTKNNERYEITADDEKVYVQDMNDKSRNAEFKRGKDLLGNDKMLLNSLKQVQGGELIKMAESICYLDSLDDSIDSYYNGSVGTIFTGDNVFLLMHELGHAVDFRDTDDSSDEKYKETFKNTISADKEVNAAYTKEREEFLKHFGKAERTHIDYFINSENHIAGENGAIGETIAETNALMCSPKTVDCLNYRAQYLQQYFPKTLATVAKKLG